MKVSRHFMPGYHHKVPSGHTPVSFMLMRMRGIPTKGPRLHRLLPLWQCSFFDQEPQRIIESCPGRGG